MGMIERILGFVFGSNSRALRDTVEVFRENAEAGAGRSAEIQKQAMSQLGAEFAAPRLGRFDRFMDGLNRLPRPALALGTLGLFVSAMVHPLWFAERMQGIALVPEPLWWLLGVIVSFYFGARHQVKAQDFQRDIAASMIRVPQMIENVQALEKMRFVNGPAAQTGTDAALETASLMPQENPALIAWQAARR